MPITLGLCELEAALVMPLGPAIAGKNLEVDALEAALDTPLGPAIVGKDLEVDALVSEIGETCLPVYASRPAITLLISCWASSDISL